jgi:hypothetical protein
VRYRFGFLLLLLLLVGQTAAAQSAWRHPFVVGERAEYDLKYGILRAGTATLGVTGIDTVRDRPAYCFRLTTSAGVNLALYKYSIRDTMRSWVDTATFHSLRFNQDQLDGGRTRVKRYEIFPDRSVFTADGENEEPSVSDPLDEIAFLFFVRSQPLEVGATQSWARYFKPKSNPVTLQVLRRDTIEAAGRKWPTIVVRPIIKTSSLFAEGAEAQVWIADDPSRVIVQVNTHLKVGSITMRLKSYDVPSRPAHAESRH